MTDLRGAVVRGTAWVVAARWAARLLGLVNVAILARLLSPEDFGLVAMAMLTVGFVEIWLSFGLEQALIQNQTATREHYDTAWTMRLIQAVVLALILAAGAPLAAEYFRDPRVPAVVWAVAVGLAVSGLTNIGIVDFRKHLAFEREFRYHVLGRVLSISVAIAVAVIWRTYWALVAGILAGYLASVVLSYLMHPYRPRWSLSQWRSLWSFSQWMLLTNIAAYGYSKADEVILGRMVSTGDLGLYSVASDLGQMPSNEIAAPVNRVMFPALSRLQEDLDRLRQAYLKATEAVALVAIPASIGLALVAHELTAVFLGSKWLAAAPLLSILAVFAAIQGLSGPSGTALLAIGYPRAQTLIFVLGVVLLIPAAMIAGKYFGAEGIAWARVGCAAVATAFAYHMVLRLLRIRIGQLGMRVARTLVATVVMVLTVSMVGGIENPLLALLIKSAVGAVVYVLAILALWHGCGRPQTAEYDLLEMAKSRFAALLETTRRR